MIFDIEALPQYISAQYQFACSILYDDKDEEESGDWISQPSIYHLEEIPEQTIPSVVSARC